MSAVRSSSVRGLLGIVLLVGLGAAPVLGETRLGAPGYLVIEGVRDSSFTFAWQDGPGPGRHTLVWPQGTLSLPDSLTLEDFGARDVGRVVGADLSGVGGSGELEFVDGIYRVSEPLLLADGVIELHVSGGELEVRGNQLRYRAPPVKEDNSRANFIFLAGLMLMIVVLMRRARQQVRKS